MPILKILSRFRSGRFPVCLLLAGIGCLSVAPGVTEGGTPPRKVWIRGSVADEEGHPVAGLTVRLLKTRSLLHPKKLAWEDQVVEAGRAVTDRSGMFEIEGDRDPSYNGFYLRFYDPKTFDAVRFRIPEDRDITRKWKKGRPIIVTRILEFHPEWGEVTRWIHRYGESSGPARILLSLGLPDRVEGSPEGDRQEWCYDRPGICYHLQGGEVLGEDRFPAGSSPATEEG